MIVLTLFIIVLSTIIYLLRRRYTFWSRQGIKGYNFLELKGFYTQHHKYIMERCQMWGRIWGGYGVTDRYLTVNEPDLIREIFIKNFDSFPHHKMFNIGPDPKVNKMLFFMPGDENWKKVRSIVTPAFTSGKLKAMLSHISGITDKLTKNLEVHEKKDEIVDMRKYIGAFAMDVISACAYGIDIDSVNNPEHPVVVNAKKMFGLNANLSIILSIIAPGIAKKLRLNFFDTEATDYFDRLTNQIVTERKKLNKYSNGEKGKRKTDFIQLMIDSEKSDKDLGYDSNSDEEVTQNTEQTFKNKSMGILTPDELTAQSILFFIAGYDTTSAALSHAVYYLAQNNDCQQKLYEELKDVKEFSYEMLTQLKYLCAVIDETLRLAPSLIRVQRQCEKDFELNGIKIPRGTSIEVLPYVIHRDPDFWPEPNQFKPERFLEPKHHPWAYLPFGGGPRICVGQRFALQEMRMCCAKLFKKFEFTLAPEFEELDYFNGNILLSPKKVLVNLKARD